VLDDAGLTLVYASSRRPKDGDDQTNIEPARRQRALGELRLQRAGTQGSTGFRTARPASTQRRKTTALSTKR
jgi:hypothetical protein